MLLPGTEVVGSGYLKQLCEKHETIHHKKNRVPPLSWVGHAHKECIFSINMCIIYIYIYLNIYIYIYIIIYIYIYIIIYIYIHHSSPAKVLTLRDAQ